MPRQIGRMSALAVGRASKKGMYHDGGGLYLQVAVSGAKSWIYRYMLDGRAREMGLGPLHVISLSEARARAAECRRLRLDGIDPIRARKDNRDEVKLEAAQAISFDACTEAYLEAHEAEWRNAKHRQQWRNTLKTYASPVIGNLPVQSVDLELIMKVLEPIWQAKPETASRLRGRIEVILDWATVRGFRKGENPARWRGHLDKLLPARGKVRKVKHHAALPYPAMPTFMAELRQEDGIGARALEFLILTAARTGEVIGARWEEFDLDEGIWIVPPERMKAGKEHRVPLSDRAVEIIQQVKKTAVSDFVFHGRKPSKPLSNMAMLKLLDRMDRVD
jgi:integrase